MNSRADRRIAVVEERVDAFDFLGLTNCCGGSTKRNQTPQETLIALMTPGHRAVSLPTITAKRVQPTVISHAREGIGLDNATFSPCLICKHRPRE